MTCSITKGTIRMVCLSLIILVLLSKGGMAATSNHGDPISVAAGGQSQVSIVVGGVLTRTTLPHRSSPNISKNSPGRRSIPSLRRKSPHDRCTRV